MAHFYLGKAYFENNELKKSLLHTKKAFLTDGNLAKEQAGPVIGKDVGEIAQFGGLLGHAPIMPVNNFDCSGFINRTGRIPAPIHSFKN